MRRLMWRLILAALQAEGPIAVKFAQWASTRPDILPQNVCDNLSPLQANVRPHSFTHTKRILMQTFGPAWETSLQLDAEPLGSGCMAQVHRGRLFGPLCSGQATSKQDAMALPRDVAVKVLHPGAQDKVDLDLEVMWLFVGCIEAIWPRARYLALSEAVMHFEAFVRPQALLAFVRLDVCCSSEACVLVGHLRSLQWGLADQFQSKGGDTLCEADNLDIFNDNFPYRRTGRGHRVVFPE
ncbi:unnamed protein product, partial [Symbiodinium natans]